MDVKKSGFTVVELLVVIVVIGILAGISIVAYRNVTGHAKAVSYSSAADQVEKLLRIEYARTKELPVVAKPGDWGSWEETCLVQSASALPATADFPAGVCKISEMSGSAGNSTEQISYNSTVMDKFSAGLKRDLPSKELPTGTYSYTPSADSTYTVKTRGITYRGEYHSAHNGVSDGPVYAVLSWASPYQSECGRGLDSIAGGTSQRTAMEQAVKNWENELERDDLTEEQRNELRLAILQYNSVLSSEKSVCSRMYSPDDKGTDRW